MRRSLSLATIALSAAAILIAPIARAESDDSLPSPNAWTATSPTPATIDAAVAALPGIVRQVQAKTGIPGIAVGVVHDGNVVFAHGFGVRDVTTGAPVDADTVFQLASVSKPVGATAISWAVAKKLVSWDTPVHEYVPELQLSDPSVTKNVTIADMYAHRSGLPAHIGDDLEDLGFDRATIVQRLRYVPLDPFRAQFAYTNLGMMTGGVAAARAAHMSWPTLAKVALFDPAGMTRSSYRFADYLARPDRAVSHERVNGVWTHEETFDADAEAPAGSLSSSVNDMNRWLALQLGNGTLDGRSLIDADTLQVMRQPHITSAAAVEPAARSGWYGYGLNVDVTGTGAVRWSHSGAFATGAASFVNLLPSANLGIVVLSNATPVGAVEGIGAAFMDIAMTGSQSRDWLSTYLDAYGPLLTDRSLLADRTPPAGAKPSAPLDAYTGTYHNDYVGNAVVVRRGTGLSLRLGPSDHPKVFPLTSWGRDLFSYVPQGETIMARSAVRFDRAKGTVWIERLDDNGLGTLTRVG